MKILVGSVTAAPPEVLEYHLQSVMWQDAETECDYLYIADRALSQESIKLLQESGVKVKPSGPKPAEAKHAVTDRTHEWSKPTFSWLGRERQRLIEHAKSGDYDALWLVDSDLICSPGTLRSLLTSGKDVVSGVFWTRWSPEAPPLPQVWVRHPYEFEGKGLEAYEFLQSLAERDLIQVGGLGACTLIRHGVFHKVAYAPPIEGLPEHGMWQGEDRHFCVRASRAHVQLWADAWPDIFHAYRPDDVERLPNVLEALKHRSTRSPRVGDLVSVTLEAAEDADLYGWRLPLRGRIGTLKILPSIEETILSMRSGDERFVRVRFPVWWPEQRLSGAERAVRIRLLDTKPARRHPTLADFESPISYLSDPFYAA